MKLKAFFFVFTEQGHCSDPFSNPIQPFKNDVGARDRIKYYLAIPVTHRIPWIGLHTGLQRM